MVDSTYCKNCGVSLDNLLSPPSGQRSPCPNCGSTVRHINVSVSETINVSTHLSALARRGGKTIGFRESEREGRATSADRHEDGSLSYSILGSSPQGEEDTLSACRMLIKVLNASGANWSEPTPGQGIVDCEAVDAKFPDRKLSIQVIRAISDQDLWKKLNIQGSFDDLNVSKDQLVNHLRDAIMKKAAAIPQGIRRGLTLALDATRLPVLGFQDVAEEFKCQFGPWSKSLGFESVWLVGPLESLTWRLDAG
jgi:hypothetical protein